MGKATAVDCGGERTTGSEEDDAEDEGDDGKESDGSYNTEEAGVV